MSSDELSSSDDASDESTTWISWFCSLRGNEFFCVVEDEYIADGFNLAGLKEEIPYYDFAMETIMDSEQSETDNLTESQQEQVDSAAELLYGLIHARFIITSKGLALMVRENSSIFFWCLVYEKNSDNLIASHLSHLTLQNDKFLEGHFGQCSNYFCQKQNLLPVGLHDQPRKAYVYLFCPRCNGVFSPRSSRHASTCSLDVVFHPLVSRQSSLISPHTPNRRHRWCIFWNDIRAPSPS